MSIQELIEGASEPQAPSPLSELIAAAKKRPMETIPVDIMFGDTAAQLVFTEIRGFEWTAIASKAPRPGNTIDAQMRCNADELLAGYPLDRITIGDEHPTAEEWQEILAIIDGSARADIAAALWWVHIGLAEQRLAQMIGAENG